jgi:hypothetical protein
MCRIQLAFGRPELIGVRPLQVSYLGIVGFKGYPLSLPCLIEGHAILGAPLSWTLE